LTKVRDAEQVIDAAAKVFAAKGFEAARLEEIAAELGILRGSLYYYVPSKAELLSMLFDRRLLVLIGRVEAIAAADLPPITKLEAALRAHLRHLDEFYPESSQWFKLPQHRRPAKNQAQVSARYHQYERLLRGIVEEGIAAGAMRRDLDPKVATLGVLGACNWLTQWYRKGGRLSIDEIGDTLISLLTDGLRADTRPTERRRATKRRRARAAERPD
jgi:AcrR family transcriptional regulator